MAKDTKTQKHIIPCVYDTLRTCDNAFVNMHTGEVWCDGWSKKRGCKLPTHNCEV